MQTHTFFVNQKRRKKMEFDAPLAGVPTIMVSFYTNTHDQEVNESQAFSVPKNITKNGLSNVCLPPLSSNLPPIFLGTFFSFSFH